MRFIARRPHLLVALSLVALLAGCSRQAAHNRATVALTGEQLAQQFPWLTDTSQQWFQDVDLASENVRGYSDLGCFALGNGRVFTTEGLRYPFGTMSNTFGPTYQKNQGSLGRQEVGLLVGGKPRALPQQRTEYVMRAGVVHTRLADADGVRVDIYDCIAPEGYAICRVLLVSNESKGALRNVALSVGQTGAISAAKSGKLVSDGPPRYVRIGFAGSQTTAAEGLPTMALPEAAQAVNRGVADAGGSSVQCPLGTLKPGESVAKLAYTVITPTPEQADAEEKRLGEVGFGVLQESRDWWQKWFSDALTVETPDERINEFIPIQQYLCRIQQAELGGYSPMYMYTTCWVRDSNGPVRFMAQSGKFEEVKRYLDYYYACCAQAKRIPMNFPLDLPVGNSGTPYSFPPGADGGAAGSGREMSMVSPNSVDWSKAPTERAEVASFIILQHYWYWKQSGDLTPIKEHWDYLRRNLLGQRVDKRGRLPFHGDETYRFPGYQIFESTQKEPTDWVSMDLLSADSAWEYIAAAGALHEWAKALGRTEEAAEYERLARKVRDALERDFWMEDRGYYAPAVSDFSGEQYRYPFANINLGAPWLEADLAWWTGDPSEDIEPLNSALRAVGLLWKSTGTVETTPGCGYYVGMTPGMVVWALARDDHGSLDQAIQGLLDAASPACEYSEMNTPEDKPTDKYWGKNRIRPWEGGISGEAVVRALLGLRAWAPDRWVGLSPHFPKGWETIRARNIRVGRSRLDVELTSFGDMWRAKAHVEGKDPVKVYLTPVEVTIRPGQARTLSTQANPPNPNVFRAPTAPFVYGEPTFAGKAKTIVVTWSKATFAAYEGRPSPAAIDTKIAFPPDYLAAALYGKKGTPYSFPDRERDATSAGAPEMSMVSPFFRRADTLILDVSKYPGHCKTAAFWTTGEGKKIIDQFKRLGGKVEEHPHPRDKPGDIFGE